MWITATKKKIKNISYQARGSKIRKKESQWYTFHSTQGTAKRATCSVVYIQYSGVSREMMRVVRKKVGVHARQLECLCLPVCRACYLLFFLPPSRPAQRIRVATVSSAYNLLPLEVTIITQTGTHHHHHHPLRFISHKYL